MTSDSTTNTAATTYDPADLAARWDALRDENPRVRTRDAAQQLGTTEAQLIATRCGETVTRLQPGEHGWGSLMAEFESLGTVMALTRNEWAVHETIGTWGPFEDFGHRGMAQVVSPIIDLRIFHGRWGSAFAVETPDNPNARYAIHIFDPAGDAVHKIILKNEDGIDAYEGIVKRFRAEDQSPVHSVESRAEKPQPKPDAEIDTAAFREGWAGMTDTHQFYHLLGKHGVTRTQALRLVEGEWAERVERTAYRNLLQSCVGTDIPVMTFVGNPGMIQIFSGPLENLVDHQGWFNVIDPTFNLHLREEGVAETWIVRKPTDFGVVTSLECYDADGETIIQHFYKRKGRVEEPTEWRDRIVELPRLG